MKLAIKFLGKIKNTADVLIKQIQRRSDKQFVELERWYAEDLHSLKRSSFNNISSESVVLDLGGYEGQWTSDIYSRYTCPVYVFEPVKEYFELIRYRFENNSKIRCFQLGLSNSTYQTEITINEFASSTYNQTKQGKKETIQIKSFIEFTVEKQITHVDLMKINIEGGEYDLLDSVIANGWIKNINQLLIQFHQFVENADERRNRIREKLKETHTEVFNYEYVWEYWKLKS